MQLGFYFDQTRCIGCYTCAIACKDWYDLPAESINYLRIREIEYGKFPDLSLTYLVSSCNHCADPPCVKVCPTNAILKREKDGIVIINQDQCLGKNNCEAKCLKVCPWNIPQFSSEDNAKMQKCNFCLKRLEKGQQPICVEACLMYALDAGPIDELREKYGDNFKAVGFKYSEKLKPSIIFKSKPKNLE